MKSIIARIRRLLAKKQITRPYHEQLDFHHILK